MADFTYTIPNILKNEAIDQLVRAIQDVAMVNGATNTEDIIIYASIFLQKQIIHSSCVFDNKMPPSLYDYDGKGKFMGCQFMPNYDNESIVVAYSKAELMFEGHHKITFKIEKQ